MKTWWRTWRRYRKDPLARELRKLPWVESSSDALERAARMRENDEYTKVSLGLELRRLGLWGGAVFTEAPNDA